MRKQIYVTGLLIIMGVKSYAQIVFENGYFIDESNQKIECLIKNLDWRNNPTEFHYKLSPNEDVQKETIQTVKEFGINGISKYVRAKTNIDRSSNRTDKMSSERNPNFQEELLFLKVVVEGQASLFIYVDGNLTRFFYKLNDSEVKQLVYKKYLIDDVISENIYFKQQLFLDLKCEEIALDDIEGIKYDRRGLERLFIKYNECIGASYTNYNPKQKKDLINLSIRPGLNYSSLEIENSLSDLRDADFGNKIGVRFGIEGEFILPFNKSKWSIILEPSFQYFKAEKSTENNLLGTITAKVNYQSIELPVGIRHYFFINNRSKIFMNASYVFNHSLSPTIEFARDGSIMGHNSLEIKTGNNLSFGIGYQNNDKYSIEMRYNTKRDILRNYVYWHSDYQSFSLIFGYSLL